MIAILKGLIVHGKGLGKKIGIPTANLCVEEGKIPQNGVYRSSIKIDDEIFCAITNIGTRPSVDQSNEITIETHILNFDRQIYGKRVELKIEKFLRQIIKFKNIQELKDQIQLDIKSASANDFYA